MNETMLFVTVSILIASALLLACACGYMLGRNSHDLVSVQEVWTAAGGNPDIEATLEETFEVVRELDACCEECYQQHTAMDSEAAARRGRGYRGIQQ